MEVSNLHRQARPWATATPSPRRGPPNPLHSPAGDLHLRAYLFSLFPYIFSPPPRMQPPSQLPVNRFNKPQRISLAVISNVSAGKWQSGVEVAFP